MYQYFKFAYTKVIKIDHSKRINRKGIHYEDISMEKCYIFFLMNHFEITSDCCPTSFKGEHHYIILHEIDMRSSYLHLM